jgi:predicted NBD/HSP70 family sugar kinase
MAAKVVPGTQSWLRERNERTALMLLFDHGDLTRNRIGELTGLSKPTASQIVGSLERSGAIGPTGSVSGGRGPNAVTYGVRSDRIVGVAVDVGEDAVRSTVVDAVRTEYPTTEIVVADRARRSAKREVQGAIDLACREANVDRAAVRTVALGLPGSFDPRSDELSFIDTVPGWPKTGILKHLRQQLNVDVSIDNDVNLAAIAERSEGAGVDSASFALLWLGAGLGLAADLDGTVYAGAAGGAGEVGYLPVPWNAASIDPDAHDLQELLGQPAVLAIARAHGVTADDDRGVLDALTDHPARHEVFAEVARRAAIGVIPVLAILDPESIILGGPVGVAGGDLLAELVHAEIEGQARWRPKVVPSAIPVNPVLRGAREALVHRVRELYLTGLSASG